MVYEIRLKRIQKLWGLVFLKNTQQAYKSYLAVVFGLSILETRIHLYSSVYVISLNPNYTEPRWIRGIGVELTENRPNRVYFFTLTMKLICLLPFDKESDRRITGTIRESIDKHNNAQ